MYTRVDYVGSADLRSVSMVALIQQPPFAGRRLVPEPDSRPPSFKRVSISTGAAFGPCSGACQSRLGAIALAVDASSNCRRSTARKPFISAMT